MPLPTKPIDYIAKVGNHKAFIVSKSDEEGGRRLVFADNEATREFKRLIVVMINLKSYIMQTVENCDVIDPQITQQLKSDDHDQEALVYADSKFKEPYRIMPITNFLSYRDSNIKVLQFTNCYLGDNSFVTIINSMLQAGKKTLQVLDLTQCELY